LGSLGRVNGRYLRRAVDASVARARRAAQGTRAVPRAAGAASVARRFFENSAWASLRRIGARQRVDSAPREPGPDRVRLQPPCAADSMTEGHTGDGSARSSAAKA